jgi:hypothetical protein
MADPKTRKRLVFGARTMLIMLFVAALAILGLGVAVLLLADPPETSGWLRHLFGRVFAVVAVGMAVVLGVPGAIGLWAMAGATAEDATPVMSPAVRQVATGAAIAAIVAAVILGIVTGAGLTILDLGLIGIIVLASLGLAGAVQFSTHRGRAMLAGIALGVLSVGTIIAVVRLLQVVPGAAAA